METTKIRKLDQILLDYRLKLILQADRDGLNTQEIGDIFNITRARVHQILIKSKNN